MSEVKFNPSEPYGEINGDEHGRKFEQNGHFFDVHKNHVPHDVIEDAVEAKKIAEAQESANKILKAAEVASEASAAAKKASADRKAKKAKK